MSRLAARAQGGRLQAGAFGLAVIVAAACAWPERSILDEFFAAARLRDHTALRNLSTITFEPLERGIIVDYEIEGVATHGNDRKDVTITAPVKIGDGQVVEKRLVITLQRGLSNDDPEAARRWIVTGIEETATRIP